MHHLAAYQSIPNLWTPHDSRCFHDDLYAAIIGSVLYTDLSSIDNGTGATPAWNWILSLYVGEIVASYNL